MSRSKRNHERLIPSQDAADDPDEVMSEDGRRIVSAIREDIKAMKTEFLAQLNLKTKQIEDLKSEVDLLKDRVSKLEERVEEAEAYERRDSLVISGPNVPPGVPGENCVALACDLFKAALKINMQTTDISTAHRVGKRPGNQEVDKRNIIVKLCRRDVKGDILNACRQLKPKFYVNESLTPIRNSIMYVLRHAKKKPGSKVVGCTSIGGRVFAWVKSVDGSQHGSRNRRVPINTRNELETFCSEVLNEPVTNYIGGWQL